MGAGLQARRRGPSPLSPKTTRPLAGSPDRRPIPAISRPERQKQGGRCGAGSVSPSRLRGCLQVAAQDASGRAGPRAQGDRSTGAHARAGVGVLLPALAAPSGLSPAHTHGSCGRIAPGHVHTRSRVASCRLPPLATHSCTDTLEKRARPAVQRSRAGLGRSPFISFKRLKTFSARRPRAPAPRRWPAGRR